jgi:hypothetical protein
MARNPDPHTREDEGERLDRELQELLGELRIALPGVQVLFAFLLIVPFQQSFKSLTPFQEDLYFATLLLAAMSTALLISPTAFHRAVFRMHEKERVIDYGTRLTIAGLVFLALAMTCAITLISDVVFDGTHAAIVAAVMVIVYGWLWFGAGALQRARSS